MSISIIVWPGDKKIESFGPTGILVNRTLSCLGQNFELKNLEISPDPAKIKSNIASIPALVSKDIKILGIHNVMLFLRKNFSKNEIFNIDEEQNVLDKHLIEWSLTTLRSTVIYFSILDSKGYKNVKTIYDNRITNKTSIPNKMDNELDTVREIFIDMMSINPISKFKFEDAIEQLNYQFKYISDILGSKRFIHGSEMKVVDIYIYSFFACTLYFGQTLSSSFNQKHLRVINWMKRVAHLTSSEQNVSPVFLDQ